MGLPRQRKTKSATREPRSHHYLRRLQFAKCKNCGAAVMPHDLCGACGFYRGKKIIATKPVKSS